MTRLHRLTAAIRHRLSRGAAALRRHPRPLAAGASVVAFAVVLGGVLAVSSGTPKPAAPSEPAFTARSGWTLADLERHIEAGDIDAITAEPAGAGTSGGLLARTRSGEVVEIDLSVNAEDAVSALTTLGYGKLLTAEAAGLAHPATAGPNPLALVIPVLFLVVMIAFTWRIQRRSATGMRDSGSRFTTIMPPDPAAGTSQATTAEGGLQPVARVTLDDVAGVDEAKLELTETIEFLRQPERFRKLGARIPRGIMLWGPPGTGKTMLARAVAAEAGVPFYYASGSEFVEKFVGVGARRIRDLFAQARKPGRGVIFFDEFDAIGKARGGPNSHEEREQTLNQLLVELDGFGTTDDVIVIAATNRIDVLDPAVLRPGRFNRKIHVGLPDVKGRRSILDVHARNKPLAITTDLEEVARKTYGFSGAMLADLLNEAAILAARRGAEVIEPEDLHAGWLKVAVGTSRRRSMDERERSIIAAHEIGHAICGKVHGDKRKVEEISLFAHGEALGVTVSSQEDNDLPSESDLRARLVALMGGRAAEELLFHEVTGGASNDFEAANRIATAMVTKWGMGHDPEAVDGGISGRGSLSFLVPTGDRSLPSDVQAAATRAIRAILDGAYAEASRTLVDHLETLRRLAAYLVEHERVDGATFDELFDGRRDVANAGEEWRAAGARPRAWTDVVDRAGRRLSGALRPLVEASQPPIPVAAATVAEAPVGTPSEPDAAGVAASLGAGAMAATEASGEEPSALLDAVTATRIEEPEPVGPAGEVAASTVVTSDHSPAHLRPRGRAKDRRPGRTTRRARRVAAGWLSRAERWLRSGELEADRL